MKFRHFLILVIAFSIIWQFSLKADAPLKLPVFEKPKDTLSIGWVGDMVPSDDIYNQSVFFGVRSHLQHPDLMMGNLEGTFASENRISKCTYLALQCHAFTGTATFADSMKNAGFDFISLVNNHSYDYGEDGLRDTERELDRVGIPYISPTKPKTSLVVKGSTIGILGVSSTPPTETINNIEYIKTEISELKETHDIVILIFHGGAEGADKTHVPGENEYVGSENRGNVELVAQSAIDAGADLVLGSGPHVLRKIEVYEGKPIAYSLGNFVGGKKLATRGILGISGIFTVEFDINKPASYSFESVKLTPDGIPSMDPFEEGARILGELSQ